MPAPFETSFAQALLDADRPIPYGITAHNAAVSARRFAVYRNNVVAGLVKALKSRFVVVDKIVGEEFFAAMARVFAAAFAPARNLWRRSSRFHRQVRTGAWASLSCRRGAA